jgi:hypothetical protein
MTPIDLCDQVIAAPSHEDRLAVMERFKATRAHLPREWPTMPTFDWGPRKALTELRPRHLHMVEGCGFRREYDRDALGKYFLAIGYLVRCRDRKPVNGVRLTSGPFCDGFQIHRVGKRDQFAIRGPRMGVESFRCGGH